MSSYIASIDNRLYLAVEDQYGIVPGVASANQAPFISLKTEQKTITGKRLDKTGSRSWQGAGNSVRRETTFKISTYVGGADNGQAPRIGPMVQSALGGSVMQSGTLVLTSGSSASMLRFGSAHNLSAGQGLAVGDEIRFVTSAPDDVTVYLSAPLGSDPTIGTECSPTVTFTLGTALPSFSAFDYWSPSTAVHRILRGAGVDDMSLTINGDYHDFLFEGIAADLLDSASFEANQGGLADFPPEPEASHVQFDPIPGHLGQIWIGAQPEKFCTVVAGSLKVRNELETRNREFGCYLPKALVPGPRNVSFSFSLYEQDDPSVAALYQAARQRSPISLTLQLGQQAGQLCGVHIKNFIPEVPSFDDSEARLLWKFDESRAQGTSNDELYIAFA